MEELNLIYRVARMASVPAETHEAVTKAVQKLAEELKPKTSEPAQKKKAKKD